MPDFSRTETVVAYPFSAEGAAVKVQVRFQVGLFKGRPVFLFPEHPLYLSIFNNGKSPLSKGFLPAFPFLSAAVAEKTKLKAAFAGIVRCLSGQRAAHA
jgi:hypothetical protein